MFFEGRCLYIKSEVKKTRAIEHPRVPKMPKNINDPLLKLKQIQPCSDSRALINNLNSIDGLDELGVKSIKTIKMIPIYEVNAKKSVDG